MARHSSSPSGASAAANNRPATTVRGSPRGRRTTTVRGSPEGRRTTVVPRSPPRPQSATDAAGASIQIAMESSDKESSPSLGSTSSSSGSSRGSSPGAASGRPVRLNEYGFAMIRGEKRLKLHDFLGESQLLGGLTQDRETIMAEFAAAAGQQGKRRVSSQAADRQQEERRVSSQTADRQQEERRVSSQTADKQQKKRRVSSQTADIQQRQQGKVELHPTMTREIFAATVKPSDEFEYVASSGQSVRLRNTNDSPVRIVGKGAGVSLVRHSRSSTGNSFGIIPPTRAKAVNYVPATGTASLPTRLSARERRPLRRKTFPPYAPGRQPLIKILQRAKRYQDLSPRSIRLTVDVPAKKRRRMPSWSSFLDPERGKTWTKTPPRRTGEGTRTISPWRRTFGGTRTISPRRLTRGSRIKTVTPPRRSRTRTITPRRKLPVVGTTRVIIPRRDQTAAVGGARPKQFPHGRRPRARSSSESPATRGVRPRTPQEHRPLRRMSMPRAPGRPPRAGPVTPTQGRTAEVSPTQIPTQKHATQVLGPAPSRVSPRRATRTMLPRNATRTISPRSATGRTRAGHPIHRPVITTPTPRRHTPRAAVVNRGRGLPSLRRRPVVRNVVQNVAREAGQGGARPTKGAKTVRYPNIIWKRDNFTVGVMDVKKQGADKSQPVAVFSVPRTDSSRRTLVASLPGTLSTEQKMAAVRGTLVGKMTLDKPWEDAKITSI